MKIGIAVRTNHVDYFVHQSYCSLLRKYQFDYDFVYLTSNLSQYDGFLIPGGYDIDSKFYNEKPYACQNISEEMDLLDQKIILYAVEHKKPLLGICRGLQSINVFLGGSLKQDMKQHQHENHFICFQNRFYLVNSFHHQSILRLAKNLDAIAYSIDGEIEIVRHRFLPILGVQFHPEIIDTKLNDLVLEVFNEL